MLIIVFIVLLILIALSLWVASEYAFKNAFLQHKKSKEDAFNVLRKRGMLDEEIYNEVEFKKVNIKSREGFTLNGYLIEEYDESLKYIILVHGYSANHHIHVPFVRLFLRLGFNILLIDMRNHGESGGEFPSYGYFEAEDLDRWIVFLEDRRKNEDVIIGLHGQSMGGASVLICGSRNPKVKFVIDDCGFTDGKDIIKYQFSKVKWVPFEPVYRVLNRKVKKRCGFVFEDVSPKNEILKSKIPVLFIHGDEDEAVPVAMSSNLYNERENSADDILIVKGAAHLTAYKVDSNSYESHVEKFINNCI